jgi:biotin operon repressor
MPNTTAADTADMADPGRNPATTPEDVLDVFEDRADHGEPFTAPELADRLNCSRRTALNKLHDLEDGDAVRSKKVGGRAKVWWLPIPERPTDAVRRETAADTPARTPAEEHTGDDVDADTDPLTAALDALDATDDRRAAVRACVEHLRTNGTAQKSEFVENVYADHDAGYGSAGGWWNKIGKEYLKAVADEYGPVEPPAKEGSHTWRWGE